MKYPVMEHFYTLQGEGHYTGHAAYFIRLGGCDVGCVWCDVKESWPMEAHPTYDVAEMVAWVKQFPVKIVVITGGEPTMHDLEPLTQALKAEGLKTHIETAGVYPLTGTWDWVTLSPKKFKAPLQENMPLADELKVVVFNKSDFEWAEKHRKEVSENCLLYLQTEWDKRDVNTPLILEYIAKDPNWILSMQTHKYIDIP
ncbi:MAG TPA: 7-carboxy-7-deazaguanine synthase QueE [Chitinophagaceae bacterium]|nr:7-carboxy-7-deazaguanine synthase QueE [Chitinophagaceae bacterium]